MKTSESRPSPRSLWWCWQAGYLIGNQYVILHSEISSEPSALRTVFAQTSFQFYFYLQFLKLCPWRHRPFRNVVCMNCIHTLSLITCVGTPEQIKTPKEPEDHKAMKLFDLQQADCFWKIFLKKHFSSAIPLRSCQVLKPWDAVRGSEKVQKDNIQ